MQQLLYKEYQSGNPEKFNEDLIYIRHKDDVDSYFRDLFTTLNSIPGITFLDMKRVGEEECAQYISKRNLYRPPRSPRPDGTRGTSEPVPTEPARSTEVQEKFQ